MTAFPPPRLWHGFIALLLGLLVMAAPASARVVTDQVGNRVTIPDTISRAVVLEHHALDVVVELGAQSQLVGVMRDWQKQLGKGFARLAPGLDKLSEPGDLTKVNIEELLSLRPDVVIVTHYAPEGMLRQIRDAGIPLVQVAFFAAPPEESKKLNPVLTDEKKAYWDGLVDAVNLIGDIFGKQDKAQELVAFMTRERALVDQRTANLPEAGRTTLYMANPDLTTYGTGKYTGVIMDQAGGLNVARTVHGYGKVTMEQILAWNPDAIFVQDRYAPVADEIRKDPAWQSVSAVRNDRIYITPEYVKPWGHPVPESIALGEIWMAKVLHPDLFKDVDLDKTAEDFYRSFYRTDYAAN
jgi:iron complex transport system substrate-binding protein